MRNRKAKEMEITKEFVVPFAKRQPAFEQPALELPLPSPVPQDRQEEQTKEITLRGVWTVDI